MNAVVKIGRIMPENEAKKCRCLVSMGNYAMECKASKCPKWISVKQIENTDVWSDVRDMIPTHIIDKIDCYGFCSL